MTPSSRSSSPRSTPRPAISSSKPLFFCNDGRHARALKTPCRGTDWRALLLLTRAHRRRRGGPLRQHRRRQRSDCAIPTGLWTLLAVGGAGRARLRQYLRPATPSARAREHIAHHGGATAICIDLSSAAIPQRRVVRQLSLAKMRASMHPQWATAAARGAALRRSRHESTRGHSRPVPRPGTDGRSPSAAKSLGPFPARQSTAASRKPRTGQAPSSA